MSDIPTPPNPVPKAKGLAGKLTGLPRWSYIAALGVGGGVIWYTYHKNQVNAASSVADTTGTDDTSALSATTAGSAFPDSSMGASPYQSDPGTGTSNEFQDFAQLFTVWFPNGLPTGGGTQPSAGPEDHYTPPAITVNIPPTATPSPPTQGTANSPSNGNTGSGTGCPASHPHYNSARGPIGPKSCYQSTVRTNVCHGGKKCDEHGHSYQSGDWEAMSWDNCGKKC